MSMDLAGLGERERSLQEWADSVVDDLDPDDSGWEEEGVFPWDSVRKMGEQGLLSLTFPSELGGRSGSRLDAVLVQERLARRSFVLAEAAQLALNGPAYIITRWGRPSLFDRYVKPVAAGEMLVAIAITEHQAGSSLGEISTRFAVSGDGVVVDGRKAFVSAGSEAGAFQVVGRFGGSGLEGLGAVLVPRDASGVRVERTYSKLGGNAVPEAEVVFESCRVPSDHVLIPAEASSREGLRKTLKAYNALRIGIAAICLGVTQGVLERTARHLTTREQFGAPLAELQGLQWRFARLATELEQARLLTYRAAGAADLDGLPPREPTAMAKLAASEVALSAASEAVQLMGWRGVVRGRDFPTERVFREVRGWTIAGGTNESLLNMIGRDAIRRYASI